MSKRTENFNFLQNDTKLFKYQDWVYKIKFLYEEENDIVPKFTQKDANIDIDNVLRAVLHILERNIELRKIETKHFFVIVKTKPWKAAQTIGFKRNGITIKSYPNMVILKFKVKPSFVATRTKINSPIGKTLSISSIGSTELDQLKQNALRSNVRVVLNKLPVNAKLSKNQSDNESSSLLENYYQSTKSKKRQSKTHENLLLCTDSVEVLMMNNNPKRDKLKKIGEGNADIDEIPIRRETRKRKIMPHSLDDAKNDSGSKALRKQTICETEEVNGEISQNFPYSPITRHKPGKKRNVPILIPENTNVNSGNLDMAIPLSAIRNYDEAEGQRLQSLQKRTTVPISTQSIGNSEPNIVTQSLKIRQKDRHVVEKEELNEDMKLQQLAKSSPNMKKDQEKRRSSGVWNIVETILTPVKKIFS